MCQPCAATTLLWLTYALEKGGRNDDLGVRQFTLGQRRKLLSSCQRGFGLSW